MITSINSKALRLVRGAFLSALIALPAHSALADTYLGFAPLEADTQLITAQGSGKNGYAEAAIMLDPATNPVVKGMQGKKVVGVRCYMRADYPQKSKRTSSVNVRCGSLDAEPEKQYADFFEGWNEIRLDTPVEITDAPLAFSVMVYETSGNPYPFVATPGGAFPGGYYISLAKGAWQTLSERGNLMMQLILDADPEEMPLAAQAAPYGLPPVVEPGSFFAGGVTVHNFSGRTLDSAVVATYADGGGNMISRTVEFDPPIAPFDTRNVEMEIPTGQIEDPAVEYAMGVAELNGEVPQYEPLTTFSLHVTSNAFLRVPMVEEFTSAKCVNCPFMAYYLDIAMERFERPLVYITRHVGFADDYFTNQSEKELLYLFGSPYTYNPAIMYDRTVWSESDTTPVYGADPNPSPDAYTAALERSAAQPAYARILVDSEIADGKVSCVARGKIAEGISLDDLYLCAYMIENGISAKTYIQSGIDDAPDDAPADLADRFSHNGIVRVEFNSAPLGDLLEVDPDTREFRVDFGSRPLNDLWQTENCETVAYICRVNKDDMRENYILNAGGTRWNRLVDAASAVQTVQAEGAAALRVGVDAARRVRVEGDCRRATLYTLDGGVLPIDTALAPGIYVVRVEAADGSARSVKIGVR
ncbi:MAG: hypothetical protein K2O78_03315 [Muribaculaceae bacterium]|nr:hypothetical protein [Muribaculaceae bacterium]